MYEAGGFFVARGSLTSHSNRWEDPGVDGLNIRSFEPYSDAAMQETTRTFFKALPNKQNAKQTPNVGIGSGRTFPGGWELDMNPVR